MKSALALVVLLGCVSSSDSATDVNRDQFSEQSDAATVCGAGPTVKGIDVSVYQGTINWATVAGSGVDYAFIRVSDGLNSPDSKFATNWSGARAHNVLRGAYQFFEPGQDAIAQADMFLQKMGTLEPDDLPPVIDVEATGGKTAAQVAAGVDKWIKHVAQATGRMPIVYTGFYFWRDSVGGANETASPLWHAQYSSASCPNIAAPWTTWAFWQYSSTGSVPGISGNVDMDRFNGTRAQLVALGGPPPVCAKIPAAGGVVDDGDSACFTGGGPSQYMRVVTTAGDMGQLHWTHATNDATEANYGEWSLDLEAAGSYHVEVYTAHAYAQSKQANYQILANGQASEVLVDQTAVDGWQALGDFTFAAGANQHIHLGDNTGELPADNIQLVFDTVRLTPAGHDGSGSDPATDPGDGSGSGSDDTMTPADAGCSAGGSGSGAGFALVVALGLAGFRSNRRRSAR